MLHALSRAARSVGPRTLTPAQAQQLRFLNIHEYQVGIMTWIMHVG